MKKWNYNKARFVLSAIKPDQYPKHEMMEVAIVGRSNVGKSTLINYLFNNKNLAKTSSTPGKTTLLNFFNIDDAFMLVDLPGYGYAKRSKKEQEVWARAIDTYLTDRKHLKAILFLLDIRRAPSNEDLEFFEWAMHREIDLIVVFTKADKISKTKRIGERNKILQAFNEKIQYHVMTSSSEKIGREDLNRILCQILFDES